MIKKYSIIVLTLLSVSCNVIKVPPIPKVKLESKADSIVFDYVKSSKLLGVTAGVMIDNKIVWQNAFGFLDVENKILADTNMVHRIASISKPMTSTAILQLVEKGVLDLDVPIQTYLKEYPVKKEGNITIRNLLNHTSGTKSYAIFENRPTKQYSNLIEGTKLFRDRKLLNTPGKKYNYSSYGYTILGAIIETVTNQSYGDYMKKNIWQKANMNNTSLEVFGQDYPNKSKLYKKTSNGFKKDKMTNLSIKYSAGGIQSTSGDLLRFAQSIINNELIKKETKPTAFVVPKLDQKDRMNYALGWIIYMNPELGLTYWHDGHQSGTSSILTVIPSKKLAVVILANSSNSENEVRTLSNELIDLFIKD